MMEKRWQHPPTRPPHEPGNPERITDRSRVVPVRRRKPGRSIAWTPLHDSYYHLAEMMRTASAAPPLYITQAALASIDAHLRETSSLLPFGLLVGELCVDPATELEYLLIDEAVRSRRDLTDADEDPDAQVVADLTALADDAFLQERLAIGWYIGGMSIEPRVSAEDLTLFRATFPEPWQVMLMRDGPADARQGAFIRFEPMNQRSYAAAFFEVLAEPPRRKSALPRTAVRWENYRAAEPVELFDEQEAEALRSAPPPPASITDRIGSMLRRPPPETREAAPKAVPERRPDPPRPPAPRGSSRPAPPRASSSPRTAPAHAARTPQQEGKEIPDFVVGPPPPPRVTFPVIVSETDDEVPLQPLPPTAKGGATPLIIAAVGLLALIGAYLLAR